MATVCIYILKLSKERFEILESNETTFAEPVNDFSFSRKLPLVCFIIDSENKLTHIGKSKRGIRAGTDLRRLNVSDIIRINTPIPVEVINSHIPKKFKRWISNRLLDGGLIPPASLTPLIDIVIRIAPETSELILKYGSRRIEVLKKISNKAKESLGMQKEAIATALLISGIKRDSLQAWSPPNSQPDSFLDGLESVRLKEDAIIYSDLTKVPGFDLVNMKPTGAAVFQGDKQRLTVLLANKLPLEQQLGTDLIYYNETHKAFIMVQYKVMEKQRDGKYVYRFPDKQLSEEIVRMKSVLQEIKKHSRDSQINGFRLNENPFFLKFCPRITFNPDDTGLMTGMYIHLDYWDLIEADTNLIGPRGGRILSYENIGRYLDNTGFMYLVTNAWVGTNINQSLFLEKIIREVIQSGKAVILAVKTSKSIEINSDEDESDNEQGLWKSEDIFI